MYAEQYNETAPLLYRRQGMPFVAFWFCSFASGRARARARARRGYGGFDPSDPSLTSMPERFSWLVRYQR